MTMNPLKLKHWFAPVLLLTATASASYATTDPDTLLMGLRGHGDRAAQICGRIPGCAILGDKTREFDNGNTFVQVQGEMTNRRVIVALPDFMDANQLMEALIKVNTARISAARQVVVYADIPLTQVLVLDQQRETIRVDLPSLFRTAGAELVGIGARSYPLLLQARAAPIRDVNATYVANLSHGELAAELATALGVPYQPSADGLPPSGARVFLVAPSADPVNETFFRTLATIRRLSDRGAQVHLVTPYLPYARSDKVDQPNVTVTGRLVADLIQDAGTRTVTFVRPHAPQSQGFFSIPTFNVSGRETIQQGLAGYRVELVISPDAGFQKDATFYADDLGVPVGVINKQRDPISGEAKLVDISGPSVQGRTVALIDDETASGGSLAKGAAFLKKLGAAKVIAIVTHLAGNAAKATESPDIDAMVVTNTLPMQTGRAGNLNVLSVTPEVAAKLRPLVRTYAGAGQCELQLKGAGDL
jgi:ribose-phosphate pyrophosphokinase